MKKKKNFRKSYKRKLIRPFYKKRFFWIIAIILICVSLSIYFLFFSHFFRVENIRISGNETVSQEEILEIINEKIFFDLSFFHSRTIFLLRTAEVFTQVEQRFPEIHSLTIKRSFPNELIVNIRERKAIAIWCRQRESEDCFFIDEEGIIFRNTAPAGMAIIRGGDKNVTLGKSALSREEMKALIEIWAGVKDINIISFTVANPNIDAETADRWSIRFNIMEPISAQILKLTLTMQERIPLERRPFLDYIDLRFKDRVYFKYKEVESGH